MGIKSWKRCKIKVYFAALLMLYYLLPVWNRGGQPIGLLPASGSLFFMEWFLPAAWVSSVGVKGWIEGVEVSFV